MRTLGIRWNKLRRLINLQCGPGAAIIPPEVTRIHLDFAFRMNNGHMGPRKFWKDVLPRLKYHNPRLPMIVNRHSDNERKPTMTIYVRDKSADASADAPAPIQPASSWNDLSKAQPPAAGERVITIDMKDRHSSQILEYLIAETRAVPLKPTPEQVEEMQSLEQLSQQSKTDRARVLSDRMEKKREEDMLKRARAAGGLADADA